MSERASERERAGPRDVLVMVIGQRRKEKSLIALRGGSISICLVNSSCFCDCRVRNRSDCPRTADKRFEDADFKLFIGLSAELETGSAAWYVQADSIIASRPSSPAELEGYPRGIRRDTRATRPFSRARLHSSRV